MTKYDCFIKNAEMLNSKFNIVPLLYGSLGLEVLTNTSLNADDIDILIPEIYVTGGKWTEFKTLLENNGYVLVDEHEHTFRKDGVDYSYASIEGLKDFADIDTCDIELRRVSNVKFMLLSLNQYLKVYQKSSQDGYRMNVKEKQDNQKIKFIKKVMKVSIRKAKIGDEKILAYIQTQAWRSAFSDIISADDMEKYTNVEKAEEMYTNVLKSGYADVSILEIDGKPHCICAWSKARNPDFADCAEIICIHSLCDNWGKGYGSMMMNHILNEIKNSGFKNVILWVFEKNTRARRFYERHGFELTGNTQLSYGAVEVMYRKKFSV